MFLGILYPLDGPGLAHILISSFLKSHNLLNKRLVDIYQYMYIYMKSKLFFDYSSLSQIKGCFQYRYKEFRMFTPGRIIGEGR
jgi:hypothetical protein